MLHHVLRLFKLFEQTVDLLHRYARTGGDAFFAARFNELRLAAFLQRHRIDDAQRAAQILLHVLVAHFARSLLKLCGHFFHERGEAPKAGHLLKLCSEVRQVEFVPGIPFFSLLETDYFLRLP